MLAAACACCSCASITASCCCKATRAISPRTAKALYFVMVGLSGLLAVIMDIWGDKMTTHSSWFHTTYIGCARDSVKDCFGTQAVFRISLACVVFFVLMLVGSFSSSFHLGVWGLKFLLWGILNIASFFLPYDFKGYAEAARVISFFFLLAQVIIVIDMAHTVHDKLMEKIAEVNERYASTHDEVGLCQNVWSVCYLCLVLVLQAVAWGVLIAMYSFSSEDGKGCSTNQAVLAITLVAGVLCTVMSGWYSGKGLLAPSWMFLYFVWLAWSAITNNPSYDCNFKAGKDSATSIVVSVVVALVSLVYTCYSATSSFPGLAAADHGHVKTDDDATAAGGGGDDDDKTLTSALITSGGGEAKATGDEEQGLVAAGAGASASAAATAPRKASTDSDGEPKVERFWLFHIIMVLASFYMAMVLTDWSVDPTKRTRLTEPSKDAMWVKIAVQWVGILIFVWSLLAPKLFPDRDFS